MAYPLADIRRDLFASVLSDCLDAVGLMDQALPSRIRPLDEASVMVGRARTAQFIEVERHEPGTNPYDLEIALIDSLAPATSRCSPASIRSASRRGESFSPRRRRCAARPAR